MIRNGIGIIPLFLKKKFPKIREPFKEDICYFNLARLTFFIHISKNIINFNK